VVLPGAIAERGEALAEGLAQSILLGAGQFCTQPGLVFLLEGEAEDRFVARLAEHVLAAPAFTLLNPGIRQGHRRALEGVPSVPGVTVRVAGEARGAAGCTASLFEAPAAVWSRSPLLQSEAFGPSSVVVRCRDVTELLETLASVEGQLTGTIHAGEGDGLETVRRVVDVLAGRVGRVVLNGFPTGVEVCHAMVHGGPYPATTAPATTSVGTLAIRRFVRPVAYQSVPDALLPQALQNANPLGILRLVDGGWTRDPIV
jgi:NADP-dependent aldehyde dehydrogenase